MEHEKIMKKKFKEGGEKIRQYARDYGLNFGMLSLALDEKVPNAHIAPVGGQTWKIYQQLKRDGYTDSLPWAETVDPFSDPYKGVGIGAFDDNNQLVLSEKIIKNKNVPGELKIFIATIDALSSRAGYCSASDMELGEMLSLGENRVLDVLIYLLGLKLVDIEELESGVRQIRVVGEHYE